jgi:hypothetical protein
MEKGVDPKEEEIKIFSEIGRQAEQKASDKISDEFWQEIGYYELSKKLDEASHFIEINLQEQVKPTAEKLLGKNIDPFVVRDIVVGRFIRWRSERRIISLLPDLCKDRWQQRIAKKREAVKKIKRLEAEAAAGGSTELPGTQQPIEQESVPSDEERIKHIIKVDLVPGMEQYQIAKYGTKWNKKLALEIDTDARVILAIVDKDEIAEPEAAASRSR